MPDNRPPTDDKKLTNLLLGQLPPDEMEQLSATLADDKRVVPAAESLADDTLLSVVKNADTSVDPLGDRLAERMVERLQPTIGAATLTGPPGGADAAGDEPIPQMLEYFRIEKVLGQGGMGTVYLADDTRLGRKVAVKTLRASVARKPGAKERFFREARAAAALEHESVVPIYYVGESGDTPFLAMPLLRGRGLDEHLEANGGKLPVAEAVRVASQVVGGLAMAHAAGLIHRDIKPSNIWVDGDGKRVRILDFGLARFEADNSNLTASGLIVGTPAYMAPEQARGQTVDARADLFSVGVMLYEMITGRRPFTGPDTVAILSSLALDTPPEPVAVNPECPAALSDLVMKLLAKDPAGRPATANAVKAALDRLDGAALDADRTRPDLGRVEAPRPQPAPKPIPKPTSKTAPRRKFPVGIAAAVALGLLLLAGGGLAVMQLVFTNKDGTLVVEVDESADVRFKGGKLEVYDEAGKKLYTLEPSDKNKTLPPGKYSVKVTGADGLKLDTETFQIEKNGKVFVKVTAAGPKDVAVVDPKKPDPVTPGGGDARYALRFDVHSDGVRWHAVEMPTLKLPTKDPVTIEGWVKMDDPLGGYNNVLFGSQLQLAVGRGGGYVYTLPPGGKEAVSTGVPPLDVEKAFYALGKWQHVAVVRDADEVRTYLDGKLAARAACKGTLAEGTGFVFGNAGNKLSLREVRVSSAARYKGDKFNPESRFAPDKQTLALFHCDEGAGERVSDSSGNGHHGKISGFGPECMTKWVTPDGAAVGPGGPVVQPSAPGTPLALRKATWKPGPADNILPGLATRPAILDGVGRWQVITTTTTGSLAFSPDGKWVATTDADYLRVYDATTGVMSALARHGTPANHWTEPRWSADSKWVRCAVPALPGFRFCGVFSPDGTPSPTPPVQDAFTDFGWNPKYPVFACIPSGQERIQLFDPSQPKPIEIDAKSGPNSKAVWSPDGEWLLVVREDKSAQLFGRDGKPGAKLAGTVDPVAPPAWSADGKTIAAMASQTEVGFWKADGTVGKKTGKHEKAVLGLHWKPDGKLLAVSDAEGKRHFWAPDGTSEGVADTKDGTPGFVWAKDGKGFFTPGKYWPAVSNPSFTSLTNGLNMVAVVSPDQMSVALAKRGEIAISEWNGGEAKDTGRKILQTADGVPLWSADGKRFAHADADGVAVYDARDPKKVVRLGGGAAVSGLNRAAFSPKADRLAVASSIGTVFVCEPTGKPLRALRGPGMGGVTLADAVHDLRWHPDGKRLVVTTGAVTVTVYDTDTAKVEAATTIPAARPVGWAVFSPANPDHLLVANPDTAAVWQWKVEKEPQQKFPGLGKLIPSPDGKRVLALQAGGAWHGNDFFSAALLSPDLKDRDTAGTKEYISTINHPGPSLIWHPDGKNLVVTRLGEARSIQIRSLDGKVVEEIKPDGIDLTWVEWVGPAVGNVLVGRVTQWSDTYVFDLGTKKVTSFGKVNGELTVSPDGKHMIALEGSTLTYWSLETKAVVQRVVLLPNGEFVTLSAAGEVLEKSANADNFYRYVIEDKTGKLLLKTPAEMALR